MPGWKDKFWAFLPYLPLLNPNVIRLIVVCHIRAAKSTLAGINRLFHKEMRKVSPCTLCNKILVCSTKQRNFWTDCIYPLFDLEAFSLLNLREKKTSPACFGEIAIFTKNIILVTSVDAAGDL